MVDVFPTLRVAALFAAITAAAGWLAVERPIYATALVAGTLLTAVALPIPLETTQRVLLACGWATAVFTSEAGFSAATATSGATGTAFTLPKLLPLALLGLLAVVALRQGVLEHAPLPARLAVAYFVWLTVAALFSTSPSLSLSRVLQGAGPLFVMLAVRNRWRSSGAILVWATLAALAAHVGAALLHPRYTGSATQTRLVGYLIANSFGFAAGITLVAGFMAWRSKLVPRASWIGLPLAAVAAYAIKQGVSRTAFIAAFLAVIAGLLARNRTIDNGGGRKTFALTTAGIAIGVLLPAHSATLSHWFQTGDTSVGTLTNRTVIWHTLVPQALNHPLFGLGPGALRFNQQLQFGDGRFLLGQAHNSLVEALVAGGLIAALVWLAMMAALLRHVLAIESRDRTLAIALFAACAVFSVTMGQVAGFGMPWFLLLALMAIESRSEAHVGEHV
jgi:hypothetical protein